MRWGAGWRFATFSSARGQGPEISSDDATSVARAQTVPDRFTSHNIGVDLGFMEPIAKETNTTFDAMGNPIGTTSSWQTGFGNGTLPLGLPFLSFTYRS